MLFTRLHLKSHIWLLITLIIIGILSRLDYLQGIGIETVWITPVYESPMKDHGYDISNHTKIDPVFGTMANFDELINRMHKKSKL